MEIATLVASNFSIDGVKLSNPVIESGWDGGYSVTFTTDGAIKNGATLTISESVRNQNGIEMAEDCTIFIETGVFPWSQSLSPQIIS